LRLIGPVFLISLTGVVVSTAASLKSSAAFPLAFEARGTRYVSRGTGYGLSVAPNEAVLEWGHAMLRMQVLGASSRARLEGLDRMPGRVTYMLGTSSGATYDLYGQVLCRSIYPGVDLIYHGNPQRFEYDFHIAPGASVGSITLAFAGADSIDINSTGDLVLRAGGRQIRQPKPVAWQMAHGRRRSIEVNYRQDSTGRIHFVAVHTTPLFLWSSTRCCCSRRNSAAHPKAARPDWCWTRQATPTSPLHFRAQLYHRKSVAKSTGNRAHVLLDRWRANLDIRNGRHGRVHRT
jgi:hypothetical protein